VADVLNDPVQQRSWFLPKHWRRNLSIEHWSSLARAAEAFITGAAAVEIASTVSPLRPVEVATPTPEANRNPLKQRNSFTLLLRDVSSRWNAS
jgi:hypothetical protein